jgi:hypothetical protein
MSHKRPLGVEVAKDQLLFVEDEHIGSLSGQFADDRPWSPSARDRQAHDALIVDLPDVVETASLNLCSQKLTKGRRARRVW